jgi:hypothetical protein
MVIAAIAGPSGSPPGQRPWWQAQPAAWQAAEQYAAPPQRWQRPRARAPQKSQRQRSRQSRQSQTWGPAASSFQDPEHRVC